MRIIATDKKEFSVGDVALIFLYQQAHARRYEQCYCKLEQKNKR